MASVTTTQLIDDIDGSEGAKTVHFGLDGKSYEIDLTDANRARLMEILVDYMASARRIPAKGAKKNARTNNGTASIRKAMSKAAALLQIETEETPIIVTPAPRRTRRTNIANPEFKQAS